MSSKEKALIIFIEGQDRCGKTSIIKHVFKGLRKIHNVIDRGPMSNLVYSTMFKREDVDLDSYLYFLKDERILTFYLDTHIDIIKQRTIDSNDYKVPLSEIEDHKLAWDKEAVKIVDYKNFFIVDNSNLTIEETASFIISIVKEYIERMETNE